MLEFFRRYQRGFFIVITTVIVISFSFFGTFRAFGGKEQEDRTAFTAVDGSRVMHSELNDMINFLANDAHENLFSQGLVAGNALNDGVIANDILDTGLAQVIAASYLSELAREQQPRLEREKRYVPYHHPKAPFLTAEQIWVYYAPDLKKSYDHLQGQNDAASQEAFSARAKLYLSERDFPQAYLKQFLRYQEASHKWLPPDTNLPYQDLSLFGYHNVQDWFGRHFIELSAQFIINSAKVAEQKGYTVTKEEALGSLFRNVEHSYKESNAQGTLGVTTPAEYFQEQLRRLGMDQSRAVKVWSSILLFRRLFFENAESILVDTASFKNFYHHLSEFVDIDLYNLPKDLRFTNVRDVEKFEIYLNAVRPLQDGAKESVALSVPKEFLPASEVKKVYPELVEKKYTLNWATFNKEHLQTRIGVKKMWEWQVEDQNWNALKEKYPALSNLTAVNADERLVALDRLDHQTRTLVDQYSRSKIVDEHPEWIKEALDEQPLTEQEVSLREHGGKKLFDGLNDMLQLMQLCNEVPVGVWAPELSCYSQDQVHYYRIQVIDRTSPEKVLAFSEVQQDGTLNALFDKTLESAYPRLRSKEPSQFLKENGEWKKFLEVKESLANLYFEKLHRMLDQQIETTKTRNPQYTNWSDRQKARVAVALLPYVQYVLKEVKEHPEQINDWIQQDKDANSASSSSNEWKLIKSRQHIVRRDQNSIVDQTLAFSLEPKTVSQLVYYQATGPCFFSVIEKGFSSSDEIVREKTLEERELLGHEVICSLGQKLLAQMQEHGSIALEKSLVADEK